MYSNCMAISVGCVQLGALLSSPLNFSKHQKDTIVSVGNRQPIEQNTCQT